MNYLRFVITITLVASSLSAVPDTAGFDIGSIKGYTLIDKVGKSALYEVNCPQVQDGKPFKLI